MTTLPAPLDQLSDADQRTLAGFMESVWLEAGTRLFDAGQPGDRCYLIDEGIVRLDVPFDEVDTDATLAYVEPGEVLGELALLDGSPRSVHATAETDVSARELSSEQITRLSEDHPAIATMLFRALGQDVARKLRRTNDRLAEHLAVEASDPEADRMIAAGVAAQATFSDWDEDRVDALLEDLAQTLAKRAEEFATATVEVTKLGNVADKTFKNTFAALGVLETLVDVRGRGPLGPASERGVTELASGMGVVFAIIPVTNPVATAIYKTLIALKARNALILSFHRICLPLAESFADAVIPVLQEHGAPTELVQSVRLRSSRQRTARFMSHPDVSFVLATGGPGMVRAAYRSGTPAIGVGPGNAPTWVAEDAMVDPAAQAIVASKSFDHGLICGAEHNLVVDSSRVEEFGRALEAAGAAVLTADEATRFRGAAMTEDGRGFRPEVMGQSAQVLAEFVGIARDHPISLLVVPGQPDLEAAMTSEKMGPFLSMFTVSGDEQALELCLALLRKMGTGHTAIVHTRDEARAARFAETMPASRILVNSPGSQGVCGLTTGLAPAFTLGCGTFGGNSTTDNVTWRNLVNVKRLATYQPPPPGVPSP